MTNIDILLNDVKHSFIQGDSNNNTTNYRIIDNKNGKMITFLQNNLKNCDEFFFCSAFLTNGGLTALKATFDEIKDSGTKGRVIVGNMSSFSHPKSIKDLAEYENIDVRLNMNDKLHSKLYAFRKENKWTISIGSSNLTQNALTNNDELNFIFTSLDKSFLKSKVLDTYNRLWNESIDYTKVIDIYENSYNKTKNQRRIFQELLDENKEIFPNAMQERALIGIENIRKKGENRALVISATGTGKTYLAAFDTKAFNPKKLLFIVHRERILDDAKNTFSKIMPNKSMGILSGNKKDGDNDYVFAMINTISKGDTLLTYDPEEFDYIIIDETHRAGAKSYQKVIDYFKPKFLLGLTATPERSDDFNIYELFNHNIAYEIRLGEAIENEIIVPFHYFGVDEIYVEGKIVDDKSISDIDQSERAQNILDKSIHYSYSGDKIRCLIFVDSVKSANELAFEINNLGFKAKALDGNSTIEERNNAIKLLEETDLNKDYLDYIITRDIFNEGIDIPSVNQVILARPTQSVIVYVQQLGRGLRKYEDKDYLVVLDFIGNYKNNFLVPVALSGDQSFNKNALNMFVTQGNEMLPGACTLNFERIAKHLVLEKIEKTNFSQLSYIKNDYDELSRMLNRKPMLLDFYNHKKISPVIVANYATKNYDSYYDFQLRKLEKNMVDNLNEKEKYYLEYLNTLYTPIKRVHEVLILKYLLEDNYNLEQLNKKIEDYLKIPDQMINTTNAYQHLALEIFKKEQMFLKYKPIINNGILDEELFNSYHNNETFKYYINDFIEFSLKYVNDYYKQKDKESILLHHEYARRECFWYMNVDNNPADMSGYHEKDGKLIIFMKADKSSFNNEFIDKKTLTYYSKDNRTLKNDIESRIANNEIEMHMFVKKIKEADNYYIGKVKTVEGLTEEVIENNVKLIRYVFELENPLPDNLFDYFDNIEVSEVENKTNNI